MFGDLTAQMVDLPTIPPTLDPNINKDEFAYQHLLSGLKKHPQILIVKIADKMHNLHTIGGLSLTRQQRYVEISEQQYLPLARSSQHIPTSLTDEFQKSIDQAKQTS